MRSRAYDVLDNAHAAHATMVNGIRSAQVAGGSLDHGGHPTSNDRSVRFGHEGHSLAAAERGA